MAAEPTGATLVAWRHERRTAARHHHPDVGGDAEQYLRLIGAIDARHGLTVDRGGARSLAPVQVAAAAGASRRVTSRRAVRRRVRRVRKWTRS